MYIFLYMIDVVKSSILSYFMIELTDINKRNKNTYLIIMSILFFMEIFFMEYFDIYDSYSSLFFSLTIFIGSIIITKKNDFTYFINAFLINIIISIGNCVALSFLYILEGVNITDLIDNSTYLLISSAISTFSLAIMSYFLAREGKRYIHIIVDNSKYYLVSFFIFYILITLSEELIFLYSEVQEQLLVLFFILVSLFVMLVYLFIQNIEASIYKMNMMLINQQSKILESRFEEFEVSAKKISVLKHDLKKMLYSINNMLDNEDYEQIKRHIKEQIEVIEYEPIPISTSIHSIDCVLSLKSLICKDKRVSFIYMIDKNSFKCMDEFDLSLLLLNVLDNAIENVSENGFIRLITKKMENVVVMQIENTVSINVMGINPELNTSKEDKELHGYGIESIKMIIKKYDGQVQFEQNGNVFTCTIVIPTKK